MEKLSIILMLVFLANATARDVDKRPEAVEAWFKTLPNTKEKISKLHFFFHDTVSGPSPTAFTVAEANITRTSSTIFGLVRMIDNPLTVEPEPDSRIIGRARGIYGRASFEYLDLLMTLNYLFTKSEYDGSTLSMLAHNPVEDRYREVPIVGVTDIFRLARGIATAQTTWSNMTWQDTVVEYNVMVVYYV